MWTNQTSSNKDSRGQGWGFWKYLTECRWHLQPFLCLSPSSLWKEPPRILFKYSFQSPEHRDSTSVLCSTQFKRFVSWSSCSWLSDHASMEMWLYFRVTQPLNASRVMESSIPPTSHMLKLHSRSPCLPTTGGLSWLTQGSHRQGSAPHVH